MKVIQSESHRFIFAEDLEHKKAYPEQYSHPICGKNVRVKQVGETGASGNAAQKPTKGVVERVFVSRFGQLAKINAGSGYEIFLVRDLVISP